MRNISLDDIQARIAAVVDKNEDTSDISEADYSLRRQYINMAQTQWAETYDWKSLYRESNSVISTSTGNSSVVMPTGFRKLASYPKITHDGVNTKFFAEIRPQERFQRTASDRYVYLLGDENVGQTMVVNAGTLASGASVMIPYYVSPASLVSPVDIAMCPNPEYLVQRTLAYLWEADSDSRFPQAKLEADKILRQLLEFEQVPGEGQDNRVKTTEESDYKFRWGRD